MQKYLNVSPFDDELEKITKRDLEDSLNNEYIEDEYEDNCEYENFYDDDCEYDEEEELCGIIYKVTNNVNGKIYIGKTKKYYGAKEHGIKGRLLVHKKCARANKRNDCPVLYNAMRKYGTDNFTIETLLECRLSECNKNEIRLIAEHNCTNKKIGYNIKLGGGGRCDFTITDEMRQKQFDAMKKTVGVEPNIKKVIRKGVHAGYAINIIIKHERFIKYFSKKSKTLEENYELAKKYLKDYKDGKITKENNNKYNKDNDLPQNITYEKRNGKIVGYVVCVIISGKYYRKSFMESDKNMDIKLELAEQWLQDFKEGKIDKDTFGKSNGKNPDLPKNISQCKRNGKIIGYTSKVTINKKNHTKTFADKNVSLKQNLKNAIKYKEKILSTK